MLRRSLAVLLAIPLLTLPARGQGVATVCKDGTTSATSGRGACSGHGGVDKKAAKQSATVAKAEKKAETKTEKKAEKKAEKAAQRAAAAPATMPVATAPAAKPAPVPTRRASTASVTPAMPAQPAPTRSAATPRAPAAATSAAHASNTDPAGATAQCKDGTYSHATNRRGACARHQGVAKWL